MDNDMNPMGAAMEQQGLTPQRRDVLDFIMFEDSTSLIWPWAVPAEIICRDEEKLKAVEAMLDYDPEVGCDTEQIYAALNKVFGCNPALTEQQELTGGMMGPQM